MLYSFYKSSIYQSQQHSTTLWYSPNFQVFLQAQPNLYYSLFFHQPSHNTAPMVTSPHQLKPPQFKLHPCLIWTKLTFPLQLKKYLPVLMMTIPNKMLNLMQSFRSSSIPCHLISKNKIKYFINTTFPRQGNIFFCKFPKMKASRKWTPSTKSAPILKQKK